jgi:hypothetical protein
MHPPASGEKHEVTPLHPSSQSQSTCAPLANAFLRLPTILGEQYRRSGKQEFAEVLPLLALQVFYNADLVE